VGNDGKTAHGAVRIERHPLLGSAPERPVVTFTFNGAAVEGREGEPVAVALLAAGYRVLRTMPDRGDRRGGYCLVGRCPDCAVVVNGVSNIMSCRMPVTAGLEVRTQVGLDDRDLSA
jgi:aerobic-type carbon monoxide dehydrogenase small subunit (CoxS/CutS family)